RGRRGLAAVRFPALLPRRMRGFGFGQCLRRLRFRVTQAARFGFRRGYRSSQFFALGFVGLDVVGEFRPGAFGLFAVLLQPLQHFAMVLDLLFDAREFGADLVDLGLHRVHRFDVLLVRLAAGFDFGFEMTLRGQLAFQRGFGLAQGLPVRIQFRAHRAVVQGAQFGFAQRALFLQLLPAFGGARLPVQMIELLLDFLAHVLDAVEVLARGLDAAFGFLAAFLVTRDAGGFFQMDAQLFGPRFDNLRNHALLDDRIAARAEAGAEEQVGDVAAAAAHAVQVVVGLRITADAAFHRDLVEAGVLATQRAVGVVENQLDGRLPDRFASGRAGKDHVGDRFAAQPAGRAFAHHPADRVDDVGLATAVGAADPGEIGGKVQDGRIDEGLESGQLDGGQAHRSVTTATVGPTAWRRTNAPLCQGPAGSAMENWPCMTSQWLASNTSSASKKKRSAKYTMNAKEGNAIFLCPLHSSRTNILAPAGYNPSAAQASIA